MSDLPKNWDVLSLDALWNNINDPRRYATPQSTIEAILYCVRARGIAALEEPNNKERIARCDAAAKQQIKAAIARMREKGVVS
ncbi:MAG: hypothetical protein WAV38_34920 [Xanthobacteraceae bacterium]